MDKSALEKQMYKDNLKIKLCKLFNIKLLIIPTIPIYLLPNKVNEYIENQLILLDINYKKIPDFQETINKIMRGEL